VRSALALLLAGAMLMCASASAHTVTRNAGIVWGQTNGIFGADIYGSNVRLVARYHGPYPTDGYYAPVWSPTGGSLAYGTFASANGWIHIVRSTGRRTLPLYNTYNGSPTWSPDERHIAFWSGDGYRAISTVSLASGRLRRLTEPRSGRYDDFPAWSPNGNVIAFARSASGRSPVIYTITLGGRGRRITRGTSPSWSPTGRWLVFARGNGIYRVAPDGTGRSLLARVVGTGGELSPRWSPDGRKILYSKSSSVWVMNADGTERRRVLTIAKGVDRASWRPG
jgi:Tol biopolymer transport system component